MPTLQLLSSLEAIWVSKRELIYISQRIQNFFVLFIIIIFYINCFFQTFSYNKKVIFHFFIRYLYFNLLSDSFMAYNIIYSNLKLYIYTYKHRKRVI